MNPRVQTKPTAKLLTLALAVPALCGTGNAQTKPLEDWMAAPGAAKRFLHDASSFRSVNQHLCAALSTMCYPDLVGVPGYMNGNASHESAYRTNLGVVLGKGNASYEKGSRAGWGYDRVTHVYDSAKDAEAFVASNSDYAVISIRGSESGDGRSWFKDWIETDVNVGPIPVGGAKIVHGGMWLHAWAIVNKVVPQLRKSHRFHPYTFARIRGIGRAVANPLAKRPVWLTGHSLGGAAAVLAGYILKVNYGFNVRGAYTIGQPTCVNTAFANDYLARGLQLHRAVNCSDFVARCFEDLGDLPFEHSLIRTRVAMKIAARWPKPFSTYLQGLALGIFLYHSMQSPGLGLSALAHTSSGYGFHSTHFGTLTYFDKDGKHQWGTSLADRLADRVELHSNEIVAVLDPFLFPKAPSLFAGSNAWTDYYDELKERKAAVVQAVKSPANTLAKVGEAMTRPFAQHSAHPDYMQLIYDRTEAKDVNMNGLPGRPE